MCLIILATYDIAIAWAGFYCGAFVGTPMGRFWVLMMQWQGFASWCCIILSCLLMLSWALRWLNGLFVTISRWFLGGEFGIPWVKDPKVIEKLGGESGIPWVKDPKVIEMYFQRDPVYLGWKPESDRETSNQGSLVFLGLNTLKCPRHDRIGLSTLFWSVILVLVIS
jgi:hypothetical protein